ncbi:MAG: dodecin family protein [Planctomycetaceae bacterium]
MSVAKVIEIISRSEKSFDDAIKQGVARASETIQGVASAWVQDQTVGVKDGKVVEWSVKLKVTFVLNSPKKSKKK